MKKLDQLKTEIRLELLENGFYREFPEFIGLAPKIEILKSDWPSLDFEIDFSVSRDLSEFEAKRCIGFISTALQSLKINERNQPKDNNPGNNIRIRINFPNEKLIRKEIMIMSI